MRSVTGLAVLTSPHRAGRLRLALAPFVAEFLVIVVGVLVALGVDEYRTSREEQDRVELYLVQLDRELTAMSSELANEIADFERATSSAFRLIEGLTSDPLAPSDSLNSWLPGIFEGNDWEPEVVTLSTMVASGDLVLIDDPTLQTSLIRFRDRARSSSQRRAFAYEMIMDGYRAMSSRADFLTWAPVVFGTAPVPDPWPWERLANDVVFRSGIYSIANGLRNHRNALEDFGREIQQLHSSVQRATEGTAPGR